MYDPRTDPVGPPNGRWFRIPLPGDPFGVMLLLPERQFTAEEWAQIHAVLEAFRPGLVDYPPTVEARCPTCRAARDDITALALVCSDGFHVPAAGASS